jgi:hypothetical protein
MGTLECDFIRLLGRKQIGEEIVIRTDSIVEVWASYRTVTILYKHPTENRLVEHEEYYKAGAYADQRFFMIMRILGADYQLERATELKLIQNIVYEEDEE